MKHHFTQLDHGVSDDFKMASNLEVMVATVVIALLLHVFWRCCRSFYLNHVKKYISSSSSYAAASSLDPSTIAAVEKILNYTFEDKRLLEEALTHSSCSESVSYERLEFLGDAALGLTVAIHFFRLEPKLNPDQLTWLRKKSVCNERLAFVAAKLRLYRYVRRKDTATLDLNVKMYEEAVKQGNDHINFAVRSPEILADIVEALAGAVYVDLDFDSTRLWTIFKDVLMVDQIKMRKDWESREIINGAQDELYGLCGRKKWGNPIYTCLVKEGRSQHETAMICSVEIETDDGVLREEGDEKYTPRDARNSAAYRLLRSLQKYSIM